jgi:hypothetical protein
MRVAGVVAMVRIGPIPNRLLKVTGNRAHGFEYQSHKAYVSLIEMTYSGYQSLGTARDVRVDEGQGQIVGWGQVLHFNGAIRTRNVFGEENYSTMRTDGVVNT